MGATYVQRNTYNTATGLYTARVPEHNSFAEATFFMSTKWDWLVTCSQDLDTVIPLDRRHNDSYFRSLMVNWNQTTETDVFWIQLVSNETLPTGSDRPQDIRPETPIYLATRTHVTKEEYYAAVEIYQSEELCVRVPSTHDYSIRLWWLF